MEKGKYVVPQRESLSETAIAKIHESLDNIGLAPNIRNAILDTPGLVDDLKTAGFKIGVGSYSDIVDMEDLETGCFNVGIGYHFQHSEQCCVSLNEMQVQLRRFERFYMASKDKRYTYNPIATPNWRSSRWDDEYFNQESWQRLNWLDDYRKPLKTKKEKKGYRLHVGL